jgi:hypothetical protein
MMRSHTCEENELPRLRASLLQNWPDVQPPVTLIRLRKQSRQCPRKRHREQIAMLARQADHPISQKAMFGMWEWGVR